MDMARVTRQEMDTYPHMIDAFAEFTALVDRHLTNNNRLTERFFIAGIAPISPSMYTEMDISGHN